MLAVKKCVRFHSMDTHRHIQVTIFQISFSNQTQVQNVLEETLEVMIKTFFICTLLHLCAPVCAYLCPNLRPDFRKNLNEFPTSGPKSEICTFVFQN